MRTARFAVIALAIPMLAAAQPLGPRTHVIDKAHSEINFVADSRMLSAHGFFAKWDADLQIDAARPEASAVSITIDATSINTRVDARDNHLRSADFLDVAKHPTITFKSVSVAKTGATSFDIVGDLTMRGTTKRITVPATLVFYEGTQGRFRGQFTLDRTAYGVSYDSKLNPIQNDVVVQWDMAIKEEAKK